MTKLLIASVIAAMALLAACGKSGEAPKPIILQTKGSTAGIDKAAAGTNNGIPVMPIGAMLQEAPSRSDAPRPELSPADIARIQAILRKRAGEAGVAAPDTAIKK